MRRGPVLKSSNFRPSGRGPLLERGQRERRRRRTSRNWARATLPVVIGAAVAAWVFVIGPDLREPAKAEKASAPKAKRVRVAGPAKPAAPQPLPDPMTALRKASPVRYALLSVARDHVARQVHAAWGSVPDLDAVKGADVDLIERGLHLAGFPLREAVIRHRFHEHRRYGLRGRPMATEAQRRRALSTRSLRVFLDRFAQVLPTAWDGVAGDSYRAGDIALLSRAGGRPRFAVVSDRTDASGVSLVITLDPREHVATERNPLSSYRILRHYRLAARDLAAIRGRLKMPPAPRGRLL